MSRYNETAADPLSKGQADFAVRKRDGSVKQLLLIYALSVLITIIAYIFQDSLGGAPFLLAVVLLVMTAVMILMLIRMQRKHDVVTAVEFQNALFSSVFKKDSLFAVIVSRENQMYYADSSFSKLFPDHRKNNQQILDTIIEHSDQPGETRNIIQRALSEGERESLTISLNIAQQVKNIQVTVEPIDRPKGYFFISGREFTEHRTEQS